jgi:hypothetical protein
MSVDTAVAQSYKSRRGGLIFFGLVELAMGALCLLIVAGTIVSLLFRPPARAGMPPVSQMMVSVSLYLIGGVLLVTLGVGSMLARRWARDLSLVVSWMWLLVGLSTTAFMVFLMPRFLSAMASSPPETRTWVVTCIAILSGIFGILIPLIMILFYRSPNVRATCVALDPHPRWTERVPLPLLGLSLWIAFSGICMTTMSAYAVLPLGRQIIAGPVAIITYCAIGILLLYVSWGLFKRSLAAWWIGVAYGVLTAAYCAIVFPQLDVNAMMKAMKMPATPGMPDFTTMYRNPLFLMILGFFWLFYLGYFLFVRRYFSTDRQASPVT